MTAEFFLGTQISNVLNQEERIERLLLSYGSFNFFLMNKSHLKFHSLKGKNWKKIKAGWSNLLHTTNNHLQCKMFYFCFIK